MAGPDLEIRGCFWLPPNAKGQGTATAVPPSSSIPHPKLIKGKKWTGRTILKCVFDVYYTQSMPKHQRLCISLPRFVHPAVLVAPTATQRRISALEYLGNILNMPLTVHANTWKCLERSKQERRMNALYWHLHLTLVTVTTSLGFWWVHELARGARRAFLVVLSIPPNTAQTACFEQRTIAATVPLLANNVISIEASPVLGADYGSDLQMQKLRQQHTALNLSRFELDGNKVCWTCSPETSRKPSANQAWQCTAKQQSPLCHEKSRAPSLAGGCHVREPYLLRQP